MASVIEPLVLPDAAALNWFRGRALERAGDAILILNSSFQILQSNLAAAALFSATPLIQGLGIRDVVQDPANRAALLEILRLALETGESQTTVTFRLAGQERSGELGVFREDSRRYGLALILVFRDNSSYIRLQHRLTHDEFFDRSSGLMNQRALDIMLEKELQLSGLQSASEPAAEGWALRRALVMVQIVNLEHLKSIYPSDTINVIFEYLGSTIHQSVGESDYVFRYDESRIVILVVSMKTRSDILDLAERLADQLCLPFHPGNVDIHLQASMGITLFPDDGNTRDALLGNVAAALNYALETGQPWLIYSKDIHRLAVERLLVRSGLSKAVKHNELELRYMTLMSAKGEVKGLESLIRWRHPRRGLLGPDKFLPVAVNSRIMGALSRWVLYRIVEDYERHFRDLGLFVTLNVSAQDLDDLYLPGCIETAIRGRMPASALKIEITESECMENYDRATAAIQAFRQLGIDVLIDDFGVGQSSLAYLKDLQASHAKIDHSFAREVTTSPVEKEFISHMIALCHLRQLQVVVEGIETRAQFRLLGDCGADLFQGHYFGKPMTIEALKHRYFRTRALQSLE